MPLHPKNQSISAGFGFEARLARFPTSTLRKRLRLTALSEWGIYDVAIVAVFYCTISNPGPAIIGRDRVLPSSCCLTWSCSAEYVSQQNKPIMCTDLYEFQCLDYTCNGYWIMIFYGWVCGKVDILRSTKTISVRFTWMLLIKNKIFPLWWLYFKQLNWWKISIDYFQFNSPHAYWK